VEIERLIVLHVPEVQQAAAVAVPPPDGGPEQLVLFVMPAAQHENLVDQLSEVVLKKSQATIRAHLNPLFKVQRVVLCDSLPRNASNKVMRRVLRDQATKLWNSGTTISSKL
jgi:acetyl-CoA synthetase